VDLNKGHTRALIAECGRQGLLRNQAAYVLATAFWETARTMKPVEEAYWIPNAAAWRKKNLRYWPWHGRGFVQLTWEVNYKHAAKELGAALDTNPALALDPDISTKIIVTGMREGWFTGKKLSDYITLQKSDFKGARRIINGTDKAQSIADLAKLYDADLKRDGYGE
jgi:hypothetical protein